MRTKEGLRVEVERDRRADATSVCERKGELQQRNGVLQTVNNSATRHNYRSIKRDLPFVLAALGRPRSHAKEAYWAEAGASSSGKHVALQAQ